MQHKAAQLKTQAGSRTVNKPKPEKRDLQWLWSSPRHPLGVPVVGVHPASLGRPRVLKYCRWCVMMSATGFEKLHPKGSGEPLRAFDTAGTTLIWVREKSLG